VADYCAWCALPLPPKQREPKNYEKCGMRDSKKIEVPLCTKCREQADREGWKESNSA
jgi:hypothetical protein